MHPNTSLAENLAVVGIVAPVVIGQETLATGAIDMSKWDQVLFIFQTGNIADAKVLDGGVQTCDSDGTSNAVAISGKTLTQRAAHASDNDSKQMTISVKSSDCIANGKQYVRGVITSDAATAGPVAIVAIGVAKYGPSVDSDLASVVQVIK